MAAASRVHHDWAQPSSASGRDGVPGTPHTPAQPRQHEHDRRRRRQFARRPGEADRAAVRRLPIFLPDITERRLVGLQSVPQRLKVATEQPREPRRGKEAIFSAEHSQHLERLVGVTAGADSWHSTAGAVVHVDREQCAGRSLCDARQHFGSVHCVLRPLSVNETFITPL
eukprot:7132810-Prymnesium_polylepis.2